MSDWLNYAGRVFLPKISLAPLSCQAAPSCQSQTVETLYIHSPLPEFLKDIQSLQTDDCLLRNTGRHVPMLIIAPFRNVEVVYHALLDVSQRISIQAGAVILTEFLNSVWKSQHHRVGSIIFRLKLSLNEKIGFGSLLSLGFLPTMLLHPTLL